MPKEIERRFAVRSLEAIRGSTGARIIQGYVATAPMTVRVRIEEGSAFLTLKGRNDTQDIGRDEYEYPIPLLHAREIIERYCGPRLILKTRYRVPYDGMVFEVDVFDGRHRGLVMAEVELDHVGQAVTLPEWIGAELSHDRRYSNSALAEADELPDFPPLQSPR